MSGSEQRSGTTTARRSVEHGRLWLAGGLIVLAVGATAIVGPYVTGSTPTAEGVIIACLGAASLLYWSLVRRSPGRLGARVPLAVGLALLAVGVGAIVGPLLNDVTPTVEAIGIAFVGVALLVYWAIVGR